MESAEGWEKTLNWNLTSLFQSNRAAAKRFLELGQGGSVLNLGSVLGYSPSPKYFATHAYATTKAAIIGFTQSVAAYYAEHNIRFNVLAPALVETPMAQRAAQDDTIQQFIQTIQPLDGGRIGIPSNTTFNVSSLAVSTTVTTCPSRVLNESAVEKPSTTFIPSTVISHPRPPSLTSSNNSCSL